MKLLRSEKAASEVVGHAILLGITILGIGMITLFGVPAIYNLQDMTNVKNTEQAFTMLDSRASKAILGGSPLQISDVDLGGGALTVEPNSTNNPSYMEIKSANDIFNVTIPMGKIKYQLGDRIVAYEGGGVWSKYPSGSVMLSPPEFHYNGVTLTLPVVNISGNTSVGGKGSATVSINKKRPIVQYPNASFSDRTNPVNYSISGKVYVNITSDFYDAWAEYAESLGYTKVSEDKNNLTTSIELTVVPTTLGQSTDISDPIVFRGVDAGNKTPLENFSFRILPPNNLIWDIRTGSENKKLFFDFKGNSLKTGDKVNIAVGYQVGDTAEVWEGNNFTVQTGGYVDVDLLNKSINLTYKQSDAIGSNNCNNPSKIPGNKINGTGFSWGETLNISSTQKSLYNITQHYFHLMAQDGDISFNQCGSQWPKAGSTMLLDYTATGAITYLHITENRADVSIS